MGNVDASLILQYQNSDAESVLIHHQDIALLREVRSATTRSDSYLIFPAARRQYGHLHPAT